ncbi:MAG: hypothetical protein NTW69_06375 [Chloroflexi bacterium]|nr:hypothetical protein [Chloroflexota bacterium]
MKYIFFLLSFFLVACGATPTQYGIAPLASPQATQIISTSTPAADYPATVAAANAGAYQAQQDSMAAQQQAINAQETSQAAQVAIVAFTAQAESMAMDYFKATQAAEQSTAVMYVTQIGMTQNADNMTATYQPTADAIMSTREAVVLVNATNHAAERTAAAYEPTRVGQLNAADNMRRFGWIDYFARMMLSIASLVLVVGLFAFLLAWAKRPIVTEPFGDMPEIIPLNVDRSNGGWHATRADVPVTIDVLVTFADGIMRGKTPAFDVWQGVISRADLTQIRGFLMREHMAQHVKANEITILQVGKDWLARVSDTGECPPPYQTIIPKSDTPAAVRTSNVGTEAVGGL